jgi:hypothetical protein
MGQATGNPKKAKRSTLTHKQDDAGLRPWTTHRKELGIS